MVESSEIAQVVDNDSLSRQNNFYEKKVMSCKDGRKESLQNRIDRQIDRERERERESDKEREVERARDGGRDTAKEIQIYSEQK